MIVIGEMPFSNFISTYTHTHTHTYTLTHTHTHTLTHSLTHLKQESLPAVAADAEEHLQQVHGADAEPHGVGVGEHLREEV